MATQILDISKYDGREIRPDGTYVYHPIDWDDAKAKWPGAIVKASQGTVRDPLYALQVSTMRQAGVPYGMYHYFQPDLDPYQQAMTFFNTVMGAGGFGSIGAWLDIEALWTSSSALIAAAHTFLASVEASMRLNNITVPLGIYTRVSFFDPIWNVAGRPTWTQNYPVWLAQYPWDNDPINYAVKYQQIVGNGNTGIFVPKMSVAFTKLYGFQWTALGKPSDVPGYPPYKKAVDFNIWYNPITASAPELSDHDKIQIMWADYQNRHAV